MFSCKIEFHYGIIESQTRKLLQALLHFMPFLSIFSFIILIISVVIHEVSHGYMALYLGDTTAQRAGRLTLNPVKHIDLVGSIIVPIITGLLGVSFGWAKPVPFNPNNLRDRRWGEALVAVAGPLSNVVLALVFAFVARQAGVFETLVSPIFAQSLFSISALIVVINLTLAIFNLVPIAPLDGSKIFFALIPQRFYEVREFLERHQLVMVIIFVFFLWQLFDPIVYKLFSLLIGQ